MPKATKRQYILHISDDREYEKLRALTGKDYPEADHVQVMPTGRIDEHDQVVCAFYVGNGNIKDSNGQQVERKPIVSKPVDAADHWTPGPKGRFGELRLVDFLGALSLACKAAANAEGHPSNVSIRHVNDELALVYG